MAAVEEVVRSEVRGGLATIVLHAPEVRNALTGAQWDRLRDLLTDHATDESVRCVLLTGTGTAFCAGANLARVGDDPAALADPAASIARRLSPIVEAMMTMPKPVVVAVNGVAAGGGLGLALAGDVVLAARSAYFVSVFGPKLGLIPDVGCTYTMPRLLGRARSLGMALTGERVTAQQAEAWGLIWRCVEDDALEREAATLACRFATGPTFGFGLIKRAWEGDASALRRQLELEGQLQAQALASEDAEEGRAAFLEKRSPRFRGR